MATAAAQEARETIDFIHQGIATVAESFIAEGATEERALEVATDALLDRIAVERPEVFAKYVRAMRILGFAA